MNFSVSDLHITPISEYAVCLSGPAVISVELHQILLSLCHELRMASFPEIDQIVTAYHTVTITLHPPVSSTTFTSKVSDWLSSDYISGMLVESQSNNAIFTSDSKLHTLPTRYGDELGPDLDPFAHAKGMTPREVIDAHTSVEYYVFMVGFTAGFPYLGGLPTELHHPRLDRPRIRVPAGSVGIGGAQTGVYPMEAPGGWHLIGRTDTPLFDARRNPPALLKAGDRVRFMEVR
jgi:KipI family sensor histidine kinase inhibitor